jgi:hypothetical protein
MGAVGRGARPRGRDRGGRRGQELGQILARGAQDHGVAVDGDVVDPGQEPAGGGVLDPGQGRRDVGGAEGGAVVEVRAGPDRDGLLPLTTSGKAAARWGAIRPSGPTRYRVSKTSATTATSAAVRAATGSKPAGSPRSAPVTTPP